MNKPQSSYKSRTAEPRIQQAAALTRQALEALHPLRGEDRMVVEDAIEMLRKAQQDLEDALR
jgi:hypothetical protein